jgi:Tfp pilus assembly protein PilN
VIRINLLPGAADRAKGGRFQPAQIRAALSERSKDRFLIAAVLSVVLALVTISVMHSRQAARGGALEERELKAVQDSTRYTAVLTAKRKAELTRDSLYQQLAVIKSIDDSRYLWPHLLEEISIAMPPYTWLTSVLQTSSPPNAAAWDSTVAKAKAGGKDKESALKKARADSILMAASQSTKFRIVGHTVDIQALTRFMKALEQSPFIRNVQISRSELVMTEGGKEVTEFVLEAESERPPPGVIQTVPLSLTGE